MPPPRPTWSACTRTRGGVCYWQGVSNKRQQGFGQDVAAVREGDTVVLKERLRELIDKLPDTEGQTALRFLEYLVERGAMELGGQDRSADGLGEEDRLWLESDLSNLGEVEPYDWKGESPNSGKPVRHVPGVGAVIEGESEDG